MEGMPSAQKEMDKVVAWYQKHNDKNLIKRRSLYDLIGFISQESTLHGIGHAWNNRRNLLGVFWLLITLTLISVLVYVVADLVVDFSTREIQSQTTVRVPEGGAFRGEGLQLPSTILCNHAFFSRRKVKAVPTVTNISHPPYPTHTAMNISTGLTNYLMGIVNSCYNMRPEVFTTEEGQDYLSRSHSQLLSLMGRQGLSSFSQLVDALSYTCEELILSCWLMGHNISGRECCQYYFVSVPSVNGKCYTFYTSPAEVQVVEGYLMGFSLIVQLRPDDFPEIDPAVLNPARMSVGMDVTFTNNITHPTSTAFMKNDLLLPKYIITMDTSLTVIRDKGLKTWLDWWADECVTVGKVNYASDRESFFMTDANCGVGVMRQCLARLCNCTSYGFDYDMGSSDIERLNYHLPPCSATETLHCLGTVVAAMNHTLPSPAFTEAFPIDAADETETKLAESCVAEGSLLSKRPTRL
ncbi:hypothetical protein Pmani_020563 [Petrolisthes manimaculis]|uniref:Uncharacterized protein n=1 Tax=Petrolisthes manimaculis TaxID=1843537 RepID=A0AAE1PGG1_9EUCA|nr:hypothetical protein Pmani_020563 [Petrolisthes manimaculis]